MNKQMRCRAWFLTAALGMAWLVVPPPRALDAQTVVITCCFDLPCEYTHGWWTTLTSYRNVAQFTAVVDREKQPRVLQVFEHEIFRFVLLVDMSKNSVIATTFDKESLNTHQMESRLDVLCTMPLKGSQYIPVQYRPTLRVQREDLYLDDGSLPAENCHGISATILGCTVEDMPQVLEVLRQGIAVRIKAEVAKDGVPDLDGMDQVVPSVSPSSGG